MNNIEKIRIFYFSGTGNAKRIAQWFSEFAVKKEIDCKVYNIAKINNSEIDNLIDNALIFIISPTHGFNFPKITLDFIRSFPKRNNRIVLMNTRAGLRIGKYVTPGLTGIALMLSSIILKTKGYKIVGQIPFDMPSNWLSVHPALKQESVKYLHKINYHRVEIHFKKIFSGQKNFLAYRDLIQDILISPIAIAYYIIGRFVFAKSFYATANCDNCEACIKGCPVNAIKMVNSHPFWTFKCESCMHCMNICPHKAIETAHGLIIVVSIFSSVGLTIFLQSILRLTIQSSMLRWIIWSGIFMLLLWVLYYLQHLLLKSRFFSRIISFTSLTYYRFWGRYKSIKDSKWKE